VRSSITGKTIVAGVVGAPVGHSLSPILHNAWLADAVIDGVYVAFPVAPDWFADFVAGLRGGAVRGLNVTVPFKLAALAVADRRTPRAQAAGAANLLIFHEDGSIDADNTDGEGLLAAFAEQAAGFDAAAGPILIHGAGGAARGAAAAFLEAGCREVRLINRTAERADALARQLGPRLKVLSGDTDGVAEVIAIVNATSLGLGGGAGPVVDWARVDARTIAMDMVYRPLETGFLKSARRHGLRTVDGLAMLIGQAKPSFRALFSHEPPAATDVRRIALAALEAAS